ncbi:MAG: hypothetical protein QOI47_451 [Actinomycetota bacterium]|jgi:RNA polymerase sigma factor (sigma-70 family)|nr:hypothetical protein [Actinomycetota bacterium]
MTMLTDAVLVDRVVAGFEGEFEELYRRHAGAAWRVAQAVTGNAHDAADAVAEAFARVFQAVKAGRLTDTSAFRAYLMTATRNASLDTLRRGGKTRPTADDDLDRLDLTAASPADAVESTADAAMIADAFRNLPERWRSILWLTEVEGVATKDVADQLGISANGAAQLAVRARAGLRERFLQAHLKGTSDPECRFTVDRLGAYVGGALSPRDLAKVDQHLAGCESCRQRKDELEDLGTSLRRIVLPIPLALGALAGTRVTTALISASHPIAAAPSVGARLVTAAQKPRAQRLVAASAAGVLGLGLFAATMSGGSRPKFADLSTPSAAADTAHHTLDLPSATDLASFDHGPAYHYRVSSASAPVAAMHLPGSAATAALPNATPAPSRPVSPAAATPAATAPPAGPGALPTLPVPLPAEPIVQANVGATASGTSVGADATVGPAPAAGAQVGPVVVGTAPSAPASNGVTATVDPIGAPPVSITLP